MWKNMGINSDVLRYSNDLYYKVTNGKIKRGNSRKKLIFGCVYYAYKIYKNRTIKGNSC